MNDRLHGGCAALRALAAIAAAALLPLGAGCQMARSPWVEPCGDQRVDTPSSSAIRQAEVKPALRPRTDDPATVKHVQAAEGGVYHLPLWFEDPLEEIDGGAPAVAYESADFARMWCSWTRFVGNTLLLPASMVIRPPWQVMVSDGVPSRTVICWQHDASKACCGRE